MSKYRPLTAHLRRQTGATYPMTFEEVEAVLQDRLPPSAYKHRPWWSNNPTNHVMSKSWLDAGWKTSNVDMPARKLVFRRTAETAPPPPPSSHNPLPSAAGGDTPSSTPTGPHSLTINGLTDGTMAVLEAKAEAAGIATAEAARNVLFAHAKLTMAERLAVADRIRASGPKLHHVDVVDIIREGRDTR